jgi:hypothetical protein
VPLVDAFTNLGRLDGRVDVPKPPVDAFLVGVAKAGTTWFSACLAEHPRLCVSVPKEPPHFTKGDMGPEAWRSYADHFRHARAGERLIDANVRTFTDSPDAPGLIHEHYPDARFILVLRDPVARTYSDFWHGLRVRGDRRRPQPAEILESENRPLMWQRSDYATHLERWFKRFPRERFLILVADAPGNDPLRIVEQAYAFLGVDPTFEPTALGRKLRPPARPGSALQRSYRVAQTLRRAGLGRLVDLAKRSGAEGLLQRRKKQHYPPMPPEVEAEVRARLAPGVQRLEALLGREFPSWKP